MREIREPQLTCIILSMEAAGEDVASLIEFIGGTAFWLEGNAPGTRKPPEGPNED